MSSPKLGPGDMTIIRPRNCHFCGHGYYALAHVVQHARQVGKWDVTDLEKEQANKDPVYAAIDRTDPSSVFGFGHGSECVYTGDSETEIFSCSQSDKLSGRVVYLLSCNTANGLGPAIMENGAVAYAGYDISWTWLSESDPDGDNDPYDDFYAKGFWESANEMWIALIDGYDFFSSIQQAIAMYDEWIDYWLYENPEDPYASDCIMWLVHDRDGLVGLPAIGCDEYVTEEACLSAGCRWADGVCIPKVGVASVSVITIAAFLLIVGAAYFVMKK